MHRSPAPPSTVSSSKNPGTINEDRYEGGWIVEIDVTDAGAVDKLLTAAKYQELTKQA